MKTIKTRDTVKDIKILDKSVNLSTRMKDAFVQTKDKAEETQNLHHASPTDYASGTIQETVQGAAQGTVQKTVHNMSSSRQKAIKNFESAKKHFQDVKRQLPKERQHAAEQAKKTVHETKTKAKQMQKAASQAKEKASEAKQAATDAKQAFQKARQNVRFEKGGSLRPNSSRSNSSRPNSSRPNYMHKTPQSAGNAAKPPGKSAKNIKSATKGLKESTKDTIKTASKSVKTAERTAKEAAKVAKHTAKTAQKAAKTAKAAEKAARAAAKASTQTAKAIAKATAAVVKLIITAVKGLVTAIAAGGWVAVLVILIICLIGLLFSSVFGIFFSSEEGVSDNGLTMKAVVVQINGEFGDEIARIIDENPHDSYTLTVNRAPWKEVLAVYAVKTNTDPDNPLEVATIDEGKIELLKTIFWDMNIIDYWIETIKHTSTYTDGEGNIVTDTWYEYILHITVTSKSALEMADQYSFSAEQRAQLEELLDSEYDDLWRAVLYGFSLSGNGGNGADILEVAISQIGNVGGEIYWSWYGFNERVEWCACFVSWCANECGYIAAGIMPRFAACQSQGIAWFKALDLWQDSGSGYIPRPGDIVFFDWENDGVSDHVGFVEYVEDGIVYTVEGNSGDICRRRWYGIDSSLIVGYGTPMY
jgi:hypothetical protein